jgi:transcriptional regulator with XRE-family HTH domain
MRLLREKHGISIAELSGHCKVSPQRLSEIELGTGRATIHTNQLVESAFAHLILARKNELTALATDFQAYRNTLLDFISEEEST